VTPGLAMDPAIRRDEHFLAQRLEQVFNRCFAQRWRTRLVGGASEPLYRPAAAAADFHLLFYRHDYFASALHEVAHWCIAGARRREQVDFGYWYAPEGRSAGQQQAFEAVEYKPQALEWWFSRACGFRFRVSADNLDALDGAIPDTGLFARRVLAQALHWQRSGLPDRAGIFFAALSREFGTGLEPGQVRFGLSGLA
jgi:elongation factor P hydroxylase